MSDTWGTIYQMERDKVLGQDAASLRAELTRLQQANAALVEEFGRTLSVAASLRQSLREVVDTFAIDNEGRYRKSFPRWRDTLDFAATVLDAPATPIIKTALANAE